MRKIIEHITEWFSDRLKDIIGEITPDKRITVILIMLLILTLGNLYYTFSIIYNWGKDDAKKEWMDTDRIRQPSLENKDSIDYQLNEDYYD